jgi:hypothetical protein
MKKITAKRVDTTKMSAIVLRDFLNGKIPFEYAVEVYPSPELLAEEEDTNEEKEEQDD